MSKGEKIHSDPAGVVVAFRQPVRKRGTLGGECNTTTHPRWDDIVLGDDHNFGTDDFGFSALPGGARLTDGSFFGVEFLVYWWSSTEFSADYAWHRSLISGNGHLDRSYTSKELGFSVRCVRNISD